MCNSGNPYGRNSRTRQGVSGDDILFYLDDFSLLSDCMLGMESSWVGFSLGSSRLRR